MSDQLIGAFPLNSRDLVRVEITEYNGRKLIGARKFYTDGDIEKPTPKGLTLAIHHLPALAGLMNEALTAARTQGLIPPDEGER